MNNSDVSTFIDKFYVTYDLEETEDNDTSISFKINFRGKTISLRIEELYGMILRYIKHVADRYANNNIHDCFITIPNFFGYREKMALETAVLMTGLNLLGFTTDNIASAVSFTTRRNFSSQNFILYDIGASFAQCTLFQYNSFNFTHNERETEYKKLQVMI